MKQFFLFVVMATLLVACQQPNPEAEKANVEAAINDFYSAAQKFDYETMKTFCTPDFSAFEDGMKFESLDDFMGLFKGIEGSTVVMKLNFVSTDVSGNMASSIVEFDASFTNGPAVIHFLTYEDYILKKVNNKWLLSYFHSSHLPNPEDTDYASVHLLKVPDDAALDELSGTIGKLNEAISSLGYWDCGYKLLQIKEDKSDTYNYFIRGNWKNPEIYKIIHDSDAFNNVADSIPESVSGVLKTQLYVKVGKIE
ncbi:YybH family protein [Mangrovibacterium diazotrophicum]|uniref:SnoaL-like protein n=1 Tax=Mangrovibacterium diazotrophicum TaxID=1261403 RepID=A0A419W3H2_9BACT|nr:nuclear transport factor 2 family protein [Mangrovibacterium diazotrophicum]RKD89850.1 SnoaL-like protein [Mangrovibacterium diazotrophicum]